MYVHTYIPRLCELAKFGAAGADKVTCVLVHRVRRRTLAGATVLVGGEEITEIASRLTKARMYVCT